MEFDSLPERRPWDHAIDFNLELIWKSWKGRFTLYHQGNRKRCRSL
jgi:hypothetical protein